jgi:hypothetical protein
MIDRPTSAGLVQVDLNGFKASVDKQFEAAQRQFGLSNKMIFGIYALLFGAALGAIGGGIAIYREIDGLKADLKIDIASTKAEVTRSRSDFAGFQDRLMRLEDRLTAGQGQVNTGLAQINDSLGALRRDLAPTPSLVLSPIEEQARAKEPPKYRIGDLVMNASAFPNEILAKAPRLKDFMYLKDQNGSVVIVGMNDRVVALVVPI